MSAIGEIRAAKLIDPAALRIVVQWHHVFGKCPLQGEIVEALAVKPKSLEFTSGEQRIIRTLLVLVATFDGGVVSVFAPKASP